MEKHLHIFYRKFLDNGIDVVIKGIADEIITDVIENIDDMEKLKTIPNLVIKAKEDIYFTENKILTNDFNKLPIPNRDLLDITKYMDTRTIITFKRLCWNL